MQLLCSLLTGFFIWLFVFQWKCKSIERLRAIAGNVVYSAKSDRSNGWRWVLFAFFLFGLISNVVTALPRSYIPLGSQFGLAVLFSLVLMVGMPVGMDNVLNVCEQGFLCGECGISRSLGRLLFVPWNQIGKCRWAPFGFGQIAHVNNIDNSLIIAEDGFAHGNRADLTAAIGRFVSVYDETGGLLAKPETEPDPIKPPWQSLEGARSRFDQQAKLPLGIVVACIAGIFGLHYYNPHYQAIAKLEAFGPRIDYARDDDVWSLDFSSCTNKPTDDDLVNLEPLRELIDLNLSGCPITDAGLEHLKGLQKLHIVNLANTDVTSKGMEDLRRALPITSIGKYVEVSPGVKMDKSN
jgi:hypothetical protein